MKRFRLIRSNPASASVNMSMDEAIFLRYLDDGIPVFRIYSWSQPSFTYGFSQKPDEELNLSLCRRDGVGIAKRITAGGILFHDNEITYSIACSKSDIEEDRDVFVSYRKICSFLINFYRSLGLNPLFALEAGELKTSALSSRLCAASHEKFDITVNGKKIGGNAQKRKREVVFQHGSIPLAIDFNLMRKYVRNFPEEMISGVTFLAKELKKVPDRKVIEEKLMDSIKDTFNIEFKEEDNLDEAALVE